MANDSAGGLYLEVKLDAKAAMTELDALGARARQMLASFAPSDLGIAKRVAEEVKLSRTELEKLSQIKVKPQADFGNITGRASASTGGTTSDAAQRTAAAAKAATDATTKQAEATKGLGVQQYQQSAASRAAEAAAQAAGVKARIAADSQAKFAEESGRAGRALNPYVAGMLKLRDAAVQQRNANNPLVAGYTRIRNELAANAEAANAAGNGIQKGFGSKVTGALSTLLTKAKSTLGGFRKEADDTKRSAERSGQGIGQAFLQTGGILGGVAGALKSGNIGFAINYLLTASSRLLSSFSALGPIAAVALGGMLAATIGVGAAITGVVVALKAVGEAGITAGNQLQDTFVALKASLGNRTAAEGTFIKTLAEATPFSFGGIADIDRTLLAYNVLDDSLRQGLIKTLTTLGTVAGKSSDELKFAANAVGQINAAGVLRGTEVLQLVNSVGVGLEVLQELPQYATMGTLALKDLVEKGGIPARDVFDALNKRAAEFGPIAAEASQTVSAQMSKLKEDLPSTIGAAFLGAGVQQSLSGLLATIYNFLSSINWTPIAAGFQTVFATISEVVTGFTEGGAGSTLRGFFEQTLPDVLNRVATLIFNVGQLIGPVLEPIKQDISAVFQSFVSGTDGAGNAAEAAGSPLVIMAKATVGIYEAMKVTILIVADMTEAMINLAQVVIDTGKMFTSFFTSLFSGDWSAFTKATKGVMGNFADIKDNFVDMKDRFVDGSDAVNAAFDKIDAGAAKFKKSSRTWGTITNINGTGPGRVAAPQPAAPTKPDEDALKKMKEWADKLAKIGDELKDMTKRWFGLRSELEKGLLGDAGFSATVDQIAGMGKNLIDKLNEAGKGGAAKFVDQQTRTLIALAKARDEVAEKLKKAQEKLEAAVAARDSFAQKVREQAIAFVNALKLEETEVERITTLNVGKGVVGYLVTKSKQTKSFLEQQRERLAQLKQFQAGIRNLANRGLDSNLLEQLVAAGPEQAGDVVKQLSNSGDEVLSEVNAIQRELGTTAKELGDENAKLFYQAGVNQAFSEAVGLMSQQDFITKAAQGIADSIYRVVLPIADNLAQIGRAAGAALANAISAGAQIGVASATKASKTLAQLTLDAQRTAAAISKRATDIELEYTRTVNDPTLNIFTRAWATAQATAKRDAQYAELQRFINASFGEINVYIGQEKIDTIVNAAIQQGQRQVNVTNGTRR